MRNATPFGLHFATIMSAHYEQRCKECPDNYFLRQCYRQHKAVMTSKMIGTCDR